MIILSIDPGYDRVGFAILRENDEFGDLIHSECFSPSGVDVDERVGKVLKRCEEIIKEYNPNVMVIEGLIFSKNKKTAMNVAEVRGALKQKALSMELKIKEFLPREIKATVTGHGSADKTQVKKMVCLIMGLDEDRLDDEYDAIAIGITFFMKSKSLI